MDVLPKVYDICAYYVENATLENCELVAVRAINSTVHNTGSIKEVEFSHSDAKSYFAKDGIDSGVDYIRKSIEAKSNFHEWPAESFFMGEKESILKLSLTFLVMGMIAIASCTIAALYLGVTKFVEEKV